jgi:putative transposase
MIEPGDGLSIRRQCEFLALSRSGWYCEPDAVSDEELRLMRRMDELHLRLPFYGSRKLSQQLRAEGQLVNRKRVQRLMQHMGLVAIAPQPRSTSEPAAEHPRYPYLLRNLKVSRVHQVWAADLTYIPMAHGFLYLVAIMDWYSRRVLAWRLSKIRARSSRQRRSLEFCATTGSRSAWTARAGTSTTCSSSGCGDR